MNQRKMTIKSFMITIIRQTYGMMRIYLFIMLASWLCITSLPTPAGASALDKSVVILMYHRFGEDQYPTTNVKMEQFKSHIQELKRGNYNILPVKDIIQKIKNGESLPDKTIGITIDDAYLSVYENAYPLLKDANFPFTVFVSSGQIHNNPGSLMSWRQLRKMIATGLVDIGNHLVDHDSAVTLSLDEVTSQINQAQATIREKTGQTPSLFSYPYGEYSNAIIERVKRANFDAAFGQHSGTIGPLYKDNLNLFTLPRYALNENFSNVDRFRLVINSLPLPVTDVTPDNAFLTPADNPPLYGFTVNDSVKNLSNLKCYASAGGDLSLERIGPTRFEIRLEKAFPPGRSRINCTTLAPSGRWRWFGQQFVVINNQ